MAAAGYSFFDSGDVELLGGRGKARYHDVGMYPIQALPESAHANSISRKSDSVGGVLSSSDSPGCVIPILMIT
jgi:hypothetical protein